jgi:hypothetical protein
MNPTQTTAQILWEMAKVILPALIAGVGAWIGGRLSVSREMEKLRNERAFDHRLDWYRRAAKGIVENQWFLINYSRAFSAGDSARAKQLADQRDAKKVDNEGDQREMVLFGSRATIAALNLANTRAASALRGSSLAAEAVEAAVRELNQAYFVLANDVREHLGMERLTVQEVNTTSFAQILSPKA